MNSLSVALASVLLLAFLTLMGACSNDRGDELTVEEYFGRFQAAADELEQQVDALPDGRPPRSVDEYLGELEGFLEQVKAIAPPSELDDAHQEFVSALEDFLPAMKERLGQLSEAVSAELFINVPPELAAAFDRFDQACVALQDIAGENHIEVQLVCEE